MWKIKTLRALAEKLEVKEGTINAWKSRGRIAKPEIIIAKCRGLSSDWLLTGTGPMFTNPPNQPSEASTSNPPINAVPYTPEPSNVGPCNPVKGHVPLISWVQAGTWTDIIDNYQPGDAEKWIPTAKKHGRNAFALVVHGDSMSPRFPEGCEIVVDPSERAENNAFVVARINGDMATFKQLVIDGGRTYLKPLNERYKIIDVTGQPLEIIGPVKELRISELV